MEDIVGQLDAPQLASAYKDRRILVVGGTAGIGKALAVEAVKLGANVTVVGRRDPGLAGTKFVQKDLSLMKNATALAKEVDIPQQDYILFTNGIFARPTRTETPEGVEEDLAVSYLSRFTFTREISKLGYGSKRVDQTTKPRIFVMGFPGGKEEALLSDFNSEKSYSAFPAHMNTVVANEALVTYINQKFEGKVNAYGLNPGIIKTEIRDNYLGKGSWTSWLIESVIGWFTPTAESFAKNTLLHVLASPSLENKSGAIIDKNRKIIPPSSWLNAERITRIIEESNKLADRAIAKQTPL